MKLLRPWPDKVPSVPLADLCDIKGGKPAPKTGFLENGTSTGVPFIRMRDLGRHHVTNNLCEYSDLLEPAFAQSNGYSRLPVGTILMPRSGSVALNHRAILGIEASIVSHICALIIRDESRCSLDYLFRVLCMMDMKKMSTKTTGLDAISFSSLKKIQIPLPPLAEQKRIAEILDAADALRAKRRESLAQLDTLLQSTFLDMFGDPVTNPKGWEEESFGNLTGNSFRNGLSPSTTGEVKGEVLTLSAITGGSFDFAARKAAQFDREPAVAQRLSKDTFLICRGNGNKKLVGTAAFPDREAVSVCFPDTMIGVNIDPSLLTPAYMQTIWKSQRVRYQVERGARTTNGTHKVNQQLLASIRIPLPPIRLQHRFGTIVESVERQKARLRAHLAELDALFASLQARAFNGAL